MYKLRLRAIPDMGKHTEIIFCDDKSTDGTADKKLVVVQMLYPNRDIRLLDGPGISKHSRKCMDGLWCQPRAMFS